MDYGKIVEEIGAKREAISKLFAEIHETKTKALEIIDVEIKTLKYFKNDIKKA